MAQEKAKAFSGTKVNGQFLFNRDKTVYVNHYYFYMDDADFGPLFLKVCSYAPWGMKLCLNGHEWAKRQLEKRGIGYEALDNGFLSCAEPEKLQQICDSLGPEQIDRVFRKWLRRIPLPLRPEDRRDGYDWDLSIWQMEVSLTQIFDRHSARAGVFPRDHPRQPGSGTAGPGAVGVRSGGDQEDARQVPDATRVIPDGVHPDLHINYKNYDLEAAVLQRRTRLQRRKARSATRTISESTRFCPTCPACRNWDGRSIGACWKSNASATTVA